MKNSILICTLAAFILIACKKDRTCTCIISKNGTSTTTAKITATLTFSGLPFPLPPVTFDTTSSTPVNETQVVAKNMKSVKKKEARYNCVNYTEPYSETTYNIVPNFSLTTVSSGTKEYKCELK